MIIDCHCHAGHGDGLTGPWDTAAPLDKYLRRAAQAGIDRTVLFAAFHSDYAVANREVARIVAQPTRPLLRLRLRPPGARPRPRPGAGAGGGRALRLRRHQGAPPRRPDHPRDLRGRARASHLPVLYDVMGEVSVVELLAQEYPDVAFIIPHLGSFADDWRAQLALIDHLVRHPNVYTDTSGVRRFDLLEQAVRRAGARKILFGSDGPWLHPAVELAKMRALRAAAGRRSAGAGRQLPAADRRRAARPTARPIACRPTAASRRDLAGAVLSRSVAAFGTRPHGRRDPVAHAAVARRSCRARSVTPRRAAARCRLPYSARRARAGSPSPRPRGRSPAARRPARAAWRIAPSNPPSRQPRSPVAAAGRSSSGMSPTVIGPGPAWR